ncbi:hypothetical protein ACFYZ8_33320 [Streptomyces sp. NPDC001668]|uniref:hypothetical protein n=1 Tax=Streptomyces sp. NPDC001668 TaxID=3364598 RepID=UPI00369568DB
MSSSTVTTPAARRPATRPSATRTRSHACRRPLHRAAQASALAVAALSLATPGAWPVLVVAVLVVVAARMLRFGVSPLARRGGASRAGFGWSAAAAVSDAALVFVLVPLLIGSLAFHGGHLPPSAVVWALVVYGLRAAAHR